MLETAFEPVVLRFETDQHARRLAMARDHDFLSLCLSKPQVGLSRRLLVDTFAWDYSTVLSSTERLRIDLQERQRVQRIHVSVVHDRARASAQDVHLGHVGIQVGIVVAVGQVLEA